MSCFGLFCLFACLETLKLLFISGEPDQPPPTENPPGFSLEPLWIAILCVGIPLLIVGVLAGGKRVYAKLWFPDGFSQRPRQRRSLRHDPVGQEVSLRYVRKVTPLNTIGLILISRSCLCEYN